MIDPALRAELDKLPEAARARAVALLDDTAAWAGDLQAVDSYQGADGWHITLRFAGATLDFVAPAGHE